MYKIVISALLIIICLFQPESPAQEKIKTYTIEPVTVTATRLNRKYAATRNVTVLERDDIDKLPVQSVEQLLNHALGVSMNSRGTPGVQSDPSLRGAGFEQVLILLDGIRMNDPQTGHHNMNLPVSVHDIERIEVLRGQSSALYGPDAFGGVINIITRTAAQQKKQFNISGGSFGTFTASGAFGLPSGGRFSNNFSFENTRSEGYRDDTDYLNTALRWKSEVYGNSARLTFNTGYVSKDFGSRDFYVKGFDHYEEIRSITGGLMGSYSFSEAFSLAAHIHYKRHDDYFELSRSNPSIYTADHTTERTIMETTGRFNSETFGDITVGMETALENIASSTLGDHDVNRISIFSEFGKTLSNGLLLNTGLRIDRHSEWGTEINPSLSLGYIINSNFMLKASIGRAFRAPTFTELYSPAASRNKGSSDLKPERAASFDIGLDYQFGTGMSGNTSCFFRDQSETIDWIKDMPASDWMAVNIFDIRSWGIEQFLQVNFSGLLKVDVNYSFLDQNKEQQGFISKYAFIHPRHQLSLSPGLAFGRGITVVPVITYKDRPNLNDYWIVDLKAAWTIDKIRIHIEGMNLLDTDYQEIRDVPMPGRAVFSGVSFLF